MHIALIVCLQIIVSIKSSFSGSNKGASLLYRNALESIIHPNLKVWIPIKFQI